LYLLVKIWSIIFVPTLGLGASIGVNSWCKEIDFGFANSMFIANLKPRHDLVFIVALILTLEPKTLI
jgi:hypothetical protein